MKIATLKKIIKEIELIGKKALNTIFFKLLKGTFLKTNKTSQTMMNDLFKKLCTLIFLMDLS